jgi:hypothetical protein
MLQIVPISMLKVYCLKVELIVEILIGKRNRPQSLCGKLGQNIGLNFLPHFGSHWLDGPIVS